MRIFFDRSAPIRVAMMVRAIDGEELTIVHHDEDRRFSETTADIEWMTALASDGNPKWIVLSGDGRILKNKSERRVLDEAKLPFFVLDKTWPSLGIYEYAWKFMKVWPRIVEMAKKGTGRIYRVNGGSGLAIDIVC